MNYAIVGATNNVEKYGFKVLKSLKKNNKVIPINPFQKEILGEKTYPNLTTAINKGAIIDIVVFVVPPKITLQVLEEVLDLGIERVWFQPGSESEKAILFCKKNGIEETHNACIMLENE